MLQILEQNNVTTQPAANTAGDAYIQYQLGPTIHVIMIDLGDTTTTSTLQSAIDKIELWVNGTVLLTYESAQQLVDENNYFKRETAGDVSTPRYLMISLDRLNMRLREDERFTAMYTGTAINQGAGGINTGTQISNLYVKIHYNGTQTVNVNLKSWYLVSNNITSGILRRRIQNNYPINGTGLQQIYNLPRGEDYTLLTMYVGSSDVENVRLQRNNRIEFNAATALWANLVSKQGYRNPTVGSRIYIDPSFEGVGTQVISTTTVLFRTQGVAQEQALTDILLELTVASGSSINEVITFIETLHVLAG